MKKTANRIISCWLSLFMMLSLLPTAAFAVSDVKSVKVNTADATEIVYGGQHWR